MAKVETSIPLPVPSLPLGTGNPSLVVSGPLEAGSLQEVSPIAKIPITTNMMIVRILDLRFIRFLSPSLSQRRCRVRLENVPKTAT